MRTIIKSTAVLIFISAILTSGCANGEQTDSNAAGNSEKQIYQAIGIVKKIDIESGKITVDHEDIPGYMPAMEMTVPAADKKMLEQVKAGDKVEFEIERTGAEIVITKINKIGEISVLSGAEIFKANCARCHGERGEGTEKGISFLKGHALHHSESEFVEQVKNGEEDEMPAFKDKLSTEEIAAVVKFVRSELQKNAPEKKPHSHSH